MMIIIVIVTIVLLLLLLFIRFIPALCDLDIFLMRFARIFLFAIMVFH